MHPTEWCVSAKPCWHLLFLFQFSKYGLGFTNQGYEYSMLCRNENWNSDFEKNSTGDVNSTLILEKIKNYNKTEWISFSSEIFCKANFKGLLRVPREPNNPEES